MKQLIILVATVSAGSMSEIKIRTRMSELRAYLAQIFDQQVQDDTNTIIKIVVLPGTSEQPTTLQCIYPTTPSEEVLVRINELMERNTKAFRV